MKMIHQRKVVTTSDILRHTDYSLQAHAVPWQVAIFD